MTVESAVALVVFLFPLAYSPGPGNAFFAAIGASKGLKAVVPALAGCHVATLAVTALIGVGMGVTMLSNPRRLETSRCRREYLRDVVGVGIHPCGTIPSHARL